MFHPPQYLKNAVKTVLSQTVAIEQARVVPTVESLNLQPGISGLKCKRLDAAVLYSDLTESSRLVDEFQQKTAARTLRAYMRLIVMLVKQNKGEIRSFDGDRVMGLFAGIDRCTNAVKCALQINWAVNYVLRPALISRFQSMRGETPFEISHCVGIDTSMVVAVRVGMTSTSDIVWVGRAPNLAAKLSDIRMKPYTTFISLPVYNDIKGSTALSPEQQSVVWHKFTDFPFVDEQLTIYGTNASVYGK